MKTEKAVMELVNNAHRQFGGQGDCEPYTLRGKDQMPIRKITVTLPYPPSANRYWRKTKTGRVYVSEDAKQYRERAFYAAKQQGCSVTEGDVKLLIDIYRPRKSGDLSNRIKILEDALIGVAYRDDAQVTEIHARRFDDKANPRVEVEITQIN